MRIDKFIIKEAKKHRIELTELAQDADISYNKLLDSLFGDRLLAPEKLDIIGKKLKISKENMRQLHKVHNRKNFDKRLKQSKLKPNKPDKTERDDVPIII